MLDLDAVFLSVLNMSVIASYVIGFVLIARLLLKKAPKIFSYALWAVVLVRLLCPFTLESAVGLLPSDTEPIPQDIVYQQTPQIDTGIRMVDNTVNAILPPVTHPEASVNPLQVWVFMGRCIWLLGIASMVIYSVVAFIKLKRKLIGAVPLQDNIYLADHIDSPFVMGFFNPKIYLPSNLAENERAFVIKHEQTHINRLDYLTRILAFAALCRHWFNPLVWVAFVLSGKDMETSCDEAVMRTIGQDIRAEYAESLLKFASGKKWIAATPLAFGEGDTKSRIHNVMRYKKPMVWVSVFLVILVMVLTCVFGTNSSGSILKRDTMKQAQNLSVSNVAKIELVTFPNSGDGYRLFEESEFAEIVAFINESNGRYVANAEQISGGGQTLYITKKDGNILTVGNIGNIYLYIQDDCFKASNEYLARFEEFTPTDPIPEDFHYGQYGTPDSTETASSAIVEDDSARIVGISSVPSQDYWIEEDTLPAMTEEELSALPIPDARSGQSPVWISEFMPQTSYDADDLEVVALGQVPSLDFYVYTCYRYRDNTFQGFIVDYGDSQQLYYFPNVAHSCAQMPELYLDESQQTIYMIYQAAGGSSVSAYNLCAFQLNGQEVSLYEADFYDVADQLARSLFITYDNTEQEIEVSQNDTALTTAKWETSDFVGNPFSFYCGSQLSYRYQDGAWYVDCSIEILDLSGNTLVSSYLPKITAKMSLNTNETGQIADCSFSDFSVSY